METLTICVNEIKAKIHDITGAYPHSFVAISMVHNFHVATLAVAVSEPDPNFVD